jgi:hypothetical protein
MNNALVFVAGCLLGSTLALISRWFLMRRRERSDEDSNGSKTEKKWRLFGEKRRDQAAKLKSANGGQRPQSVPGIYKPSFSELTDGIAQALERLTILLEKRLPLPAMNYMSVNCMESLESRLNALSGAVDALTQDLRMCRQDVSDTWEALTEIEPQKPRKKQDRSIVATAGPSQIPIQPPSRESRSVADSVSPTTTTSLTLQELIAENFNRIDGETGRDFKKFGEAFLKIVKDRVSSIQDCDDYVLFLETPRRGQAWPWPNRVLSHPARDYFNYSKAMNYPVTRVWKPAILELRGGEWELVEKGEVKQ